MNFAHHIGSSLRDGYAVLDLETTGLSYARHHIIEIGVVLALPAQRLEVDSVLVKVDRALPADITRLTGITDQALAARGISIDEALAWFVERTGQLPLVGHNVIQFERMFLKGAAFDHQRNVAKGNYPELVIDQANQLSVERFIDTAAIYKGYKLRDFPKHGESHRHYAERILSQRVYGLRYNLELACFEQGISDAEIPDAPAYYRHRAAGDALRTQKLFEKLLQVEWPDEGSNPESASILDEIWNFFRGGSSSTIPNTEQRDDESGFRNRSSGPSAEPGFQPLQQDLRPPPPAYIPEIGDRVRHSKFGEGTVMSCDEWGSDYETAVLFAGGELRRLLLSYARLEWVEE